MPLTALFAGGARPRCYIASPLGFSEAGRAYYAERYLPALAEHVEPVDPWALSPPDDFAAAAAGGRTRDHAIEVGERNADAIRSCALLIAQLDGQEVDAGTAAEVGYAAALGLPCIGLRSDLRMSGEPGMHVNLQLEAFVVLSGGFIAGSLDELVARLAALRRDGAAADIASLERAVDELGARPLDAAAAQVRLASAYQRDERTEQAVTLDERIASDLARLLGPGHDATRVAGEVVARSHGLLRSSPNRRALARNVLELRERLAEALARTG